MLATNAVIEELKYPLLASQKLDGIRTIVQNGKVLTRTFKQIPNHYIRETLEFVLKGFDGAFDGEIIVGSTFNETTSAVMSFEGRPNFVYHIFDYVMDPSIPYKDRMTNLRLSVGERLKVSYIKYVYPKWLYTYDELCNYEEFCLGDGYEGVMTRTPDSPYKFGRSTLKQQWLLKIKRFQDSDARIIGFEELHHNANEKVTDELGYAEHSSAKAGLVPMNMLGSLVVTDIHNGVTFNIGSGFDAHTRKWIWTNQDSYLGKLVKYKHQSSGAKDLPRFPVFIGMRSELDI